MKSSLPPLDVTEPEIQHAAYTLWLEAGQPQGRDLEIWLAAKERLKHLVTPSHPSARARSARPLATHAQAGRGQRR